MVFTQSGEVWRTITFLEPGLKKKYAVSNTGRIASYVDAIEEGQILKTRLFDGFPGFSYRIKGKNKTILTHKLVLQVFGFPQPDESHRVIHLDYNKLNNRLDNLKWASKDEWLTHQNGNPKVVEGRRKKAGMKTQVGHKLNATQVARIKKKLLDPKRKTRVKLLAKQLGVTEMTLYRIKSGENWGHVKPAH
ncbi:MAG TPA: NUMOD4 domain-containing protein [Luteibaculaceae bacterium]|nr:NUMOD4 domain-containing protein [Luteibaculaceae bacterium]